jgi:hypothetical protein
MSARDVTAFQFAQARESGSGEEARWIVGGGIGPAGWRLERRMEMNTRRGSGGRTRSKTCSGGMPFRGRRSESVCSPSQPGGGAGDGSPKCIITYMDERVGRR